MAVAAAEPWAHTPTDVLARVKHTLLQGKTARIVVFSGIKFRLTDNVGVWIDIHVTKDDSTAEFGMSLYGGHGGSLVLGLLVPDGRASLVQSVRAPDAETALRAIWNHLYKFAQDLLVGTATAAVAETVVLHKTQDVVATISAGTAGYAYEIAALSAAGATALVNIPRTGVVPGPDIGAVHAHVLAQLQPVQAAAEPQVHHAAKPVLKIWLEMHDAVQAWARKHADEVVAEQGNTKVHVDGSGERAGDRGLVPLYTTVNGKRKTVATPEQGDDDFPSPYMRFHLGDYGRTATFQLCVDTGRMTKEKTVHTSTHGADVNPNKFIPIVLAVIRQAIAPDLHQVRADTEDQEVTAASCFHVVESAIGDGSKLIGKTILGFQVETVDLLQVRLDVVAFRARGGEHTAFVRIAPDKSVTAQVFQGVRAQSFVTTLRSTRLSAIVNALQFPDTEEQTATAAAEPHRHFEDKDLVAAWFQEAQRFVTAHQGKVIAGFGKFQVHVHGTAGHRGSASAAVDIPLYTTYDGVEVDTRWHGSVFALPEFSFRLGLKPATNTHVLAVHTNIGAFLLELPEKEVTTSVPAPQPQHLMPTLIKILRNDIQRLYQHVDISKLTLRSGQAEAAAEPPAVGSNAYKVLEKIQRLRIQSKHYHIHFRIVDKPHADDHGNLYILGDVVPDETAEAALGSSSYRYGFAVKVRGNDDYTVSDTNPYEIVLPHVYPDPTAPLEVPTRKQLAPAGASMQDVARALTKLLLPWFRELDAKVDDDVAVAAALSMPSADLAGEYFQAKPRPKLEYNASTRERSRRYMVDLKEAVMYKVFDQELKPMPGDAHKYVFFARVHPGAAEGKVQVSFAAGEATHDGNLNTGRSPSPLRFDGRPVTVDAAGVAGLVRSQLRDYIYRLDDAFHAANS